MSTPGTVPKPKINPVFWIYLCWAAYWLYQSGMDFLYIIPSLRVMKKVTSQVAWQWFAQSLVSILILFLPIILYMILDYVPRFKHRRFCIEHWQEYHKRAIYWESPPEFSGFLLCYSAAIGLYGVKNWEDYVWIPLLLMSPIAYFLNHYLPKKRLYKLFRDKSDQYKPLKDAEAVRPKFMVGFLFWSAHFLYLGWLGYKDSYNDRKTALLILFVICVFVAPLLCYVVEEYLPKKRLYQIYVKDDTAYAYANYVEGIRPRFGYGIVIWSGYFLFASVYCVEEHDTWNAVLFAIASIGAFFGYIFAVYIPQWSLYRLYRKDPDAYRRKMDEQAEEERVKEQSRKKRIELEKKEAERSQREGAPWDKKYYTYPCPYCGHYKVRRTEFKDVEASVRFWGPRSIRVAEKFICDHCKKKWG